MKTALFCCLLAGFAALRAQPGSQSLDECLQSHAAAIRTDDFGQFADLQPLKSLLKGKRVVLLGESSHGIGGYYTLKSRLVQYLHEELGFEVLAMESGLADVYFQYRRIDSLSPRQLRDRTVFGNFQCEEILPLFEHLHAARTRARPLHFTGFDSQNYGSSLEFLQQILERYEPAQAGAIVAGLTAYYRIPAVLWAPDRAPLFALSDTIMQAADAAMRAFTAHHADIQAQYQLSATDMQVIRRAIRNYRDAVDLDWHTQDVTERRDSLMADNLFWLMDSLYPGKKVIIWGHNGHIGKTSPEGNPFTWMGERVQARYGAESCHIGLFARAGETYTWWTRSTDAFERSGPEDLEQLVQLPGAEAVLLDLGRPCARMQEPVQAFEVENGGVLRFIPSRRFDAVICLRQARAPVYRK
ncbi:MAG: erythromycin esterase family protein [Bacteroidia bacterium]|nr:erythromycin esterase family protein [Bacteroidia bacterium]